MKNKLLLLVASALTAGVVSSTAQTAAPAAAAAPTASWVITPAFVSQYMFRGARLGGPSFEPNIEFDYGNLALGVWSNFPISDKVIGQSDPEIDPYGSYKFTVSEMVSIQPGFTLYTYKNADKSAGFYKSTFEPNLAVNFTAGGLTLTPKIYYDVVLDGPTAELTAAYSVPLADIKSSLDFAGSIGTFKWSSFAEDTTPDVKNTGDYYSIGVSMPFAVSSNSKLTIGAALAKGTNNFLKQGTAPKTRNSAAVGRGVFSIAYAISF